MKKQRKKRRPLLYIVIALLLIGIFACVTWAMNRAVSYNSGPAEVLYDVLGHYALNYTGNTNHYDYWNSNGSSKLVSKNYKDRTDISTINNSSATINPSDSSSTIKKAYLIWQSRSEEAPTATLRFITPNNSSWAITADQSKVTKDIRTNGNGEEYTAVYTMVTDVTNVVCSAAGGYGTYTVANIPVWDGVQDGEVVCGGESVASWQLVIVEESPNFPLRTISLNTLAQYFYNINYTVNVNFADASSPTGDVSMQWYNLFTDVDTQYRYQGAINWNPDYWHDWSNYRYKTQSRGLYKNGINFNSRDTGSVYGTGASASGAIYGHLYEEVQDANNFSSSGIIYLQEGTNTGICVSTLGVAIDVYAYEVVFDGNGATSGSMDNMMCIYGRGYELTNNQFSKTHYKFVGWNTKPDGSGTTYKDGSYIRNLTATEDKVILYAQWKPNPYKIILDNQYATIFGTDCFYEWYSFGNYSDSDCTTTINKITVPKKTGYKFNGYYTGTNGNGTKYIDSSGNILSTSITFNSNTTLYAYWTQSIYKITLDNQGATTSGTKAYYEKFGVGNYSDSNCTTAVSKISLPKKTHYTFGGYYTNKNGQGTRVIDEEGNITPAYTLFSQNSTIYAYWKPNTYIISLDSQSATLDGTRSYFEKYGVMNYVTLEAVNTENGKVEAIYNYTGGEQCFVAPHTGTYDLRIYGASAFSGYSSDPYEGSRVAATGSITLVEGEVLYINVGGAGYFDTGGWNGGGDGLKLVTIGSEWSMDVNAGGGATDIRKGGNSLNNRIIVAPGCGGKVSFRHNTNSSVSYNPVTPEYPTSLSSSNIKIYVNNTMLFSSYLFDTEYMYMHGSQGTTPYSNGHILGTVTDTYSGSQYTIFVNKMHKGRLGKGGYGSGGGYYGGSTPLVYISNDSRTLVARATSSFGSSYLGGVFNGHIWSKQGYVRDDDNSTNYYEVGTSNLWSRSSLENSTGTEGNGKAVISYYAYVSKEQVKSTSVVIPQKRGYRFGGYYTGKNGTGTRYVDESGNILSTPTTFTADTTLYAYWIADTSNTYKIQFHGNGADAGSMPVMTCNFNQVYTLTANAFRKTGYSFAGWSTTPNGSAVYGNGASVNNLCSYTGEVITLYAQWTRNKYYVTFDANGGTAGSLSFIDIPYDTSWYYSDNRLIPTREGYSFLGFYTEREGGVKVWDNTGTGVNGTGYWENNIWKYSSNITVYAHWSPHVHNLVYDANGGTDAPASQTIISGTTNKISSSIPTRTGYTFKYWTTTPYDLTTDTHYRVVQNVNGTNIKRLWFNYINSEIIEVLAYVEGANHVKLPTWTTLNGQDDLIWHDMWAGNWTAGGQTFNYGLNIKISSHKGEIGEYIHHIYAYNSAGTVLESKAYKNRGFIYKPGNIYAGYMNGGTQILYAQWTPAAYTMTLDHNGGTYNGENSNSYPVTYGYGYYNNISWGLPSRDGYIFNGFWTKSSNGEPVYTVDGKAINNGICWYDNKWCNLSNVALYAHWRPITYTIKFDSNGGGGTMPNMTCTYDTPDVLPTNKFTKSKHDFVGWNTQPDGSGTTYANNASVYNLCSNQGDSITLYAQWTSNTYIVHFDANGGTGVMDDMVCDFNTQYTLNKNKFTRAGYDFSDWSLTPNGSIDYFDEAPFTNLRFSKGIINLYARWTPKTYTICFDANGGSIVRKNNISPSNNIVTVTYDSSDYCYMYSDMPVKEGYAFKGWYTDNGIEVYTENAICNNDSIYWEDNKWIYENDLTVYAKWEKCNDIILDVTDLWIDYSNGNTIHGSLNGTTNSSDLSVLDNQPPVSNNIYTDTEWSTFKNLTFSAKDNDINNIDISFNDGITYTDMYDNGEKYLRNYSFTGDVYGGLETKVFFKDGAGNVSSYAVTIHNLDNTKPAITDVNVSKNGNIFDLSVVANDINRRLNQSGSGIAGYFMSNNNITPTESNFQTLNNFKVSDVGPYYFGVMDQVGNISDSFELTLFKANLDANGGVCEKAYITVYPNLPYGTLPIPTRIGYTFKGWYTSKIEGNLITESTLVSKTSNHTLYAQWEANSYEVYFNANGGNGVMETVTMFFDKKQDLPANEFVKSNNYGQSTFLGWSTDASSTTATFMDNEEVINLPGCENGFLTLYAIWDDCPWIIAEDLYYSLYEAQNNFITYEELISKAVAEDKEIGGTLMPGIDEAKGTSFTIIDYLPTDFTQFTSSGSVTETYQAIDSAGNIFKQKITVHVVDTTPAEILPDGTTRFINEKYYNEAYENGGIEDNSIWKTDSDFVIVIQDAFNNLNNNTPIISFSFTHEEILKMKEFIKLNGIGNNKSSNALQLFYDIFMTPNQVLYTE